MGADMQYVIDQNGNGYGPFGSVTEVDGALHCTGDAGDLTLPLTAIGAYTLADSFEPPAAPTVVPMEVTMRQARLALLAASKLEAVAAAIASLPSPQREQAQIEWDYSSAVRRDRALVHLLAPALGLDAAAVDQLFIAAGRL
jgi:hypothetical protein